MRRKAAHRYPTSSHRPPGTPRSRARPARRRGGARREAGRLQHGLNSNVCGRWGRRSCLLPFSGATGGCRPAGRGGEVRRRKAFAGGRRLGGGGWSVEGWGVVTAPAGRRLGAGRVKPQQAPRSPCLVFLLSSSDGVLEGLRSFLRPERCKRADAGEEEWCPEDR